MTTRVQSTLESRPRTAGSASALDRWLLHSMMAALPGAGYEVALSEAAGRVKTPGWWSGSAIRFEFSAADWS